MATEGSHSCCELSIVLLGNEQSGKSAAGNTILGREEFDPDVRTLQCVKRQGEVAGRHVTVVDTPGWKDYNLFLKRDTPNLLEQEIIKSVGLCPPGPYAVLLVIHNDMTFTEPEKNAISNHVSLLGRDAWKHSLVLFIQETPAEEKCFEVEGKMLQWLVEKCGNRYHVLNINNKNHTQVTQLLEKIEEMVRGNSLAHYEIDRRILEETEKKRRTDEERAQVRWREIRRKRDLQKFEEIIAQDIGRHFEMNSQVLHDLQEKKEREEERARDRKREKQGKHFRSLKDALRKYLLTQTPSAAGQSTPDVPDADDGSSGTKSSTPGTSATQMREPEPAATAGEGPSRTSSPDSESETETTETWDTQPEADAEHQTSGTTVGTSATQTTDTEPAAADYITTDPIEPLDMTAKLLGKPGSGKSASGNTILGREDFKSEASASPVATYCESQSGVLEGRNITVIDTPGITSEMDARMSEQDLNEIRPNVFYDYTHEEHEKVRAAVRLEEEKKRERAEKAGDLEEQNKREKKAHVAGLNIVKGYTPVSQKEGVDQHQSKCTSYNKIWKGMTIGLLIIVLTLIILSTTGCCLFLDCKRESAEREINISEEATKPLSETVKLQTENKRGDLERELRVCKEESAAMKKMINTMAEEAAKNMSNKVQKIRQEEEQKRTEREQEIRKEEEAKLTERVKVVREEEEKKRQEKEREIREEEKQKRLDGEKIREEQEFIRQALLEQLKQKIEQLKEKLRITEEERSQCNTTNLICIAVIVVIILCLILCLIRLYSV